MRVMEWGEKLPSRTSNRIRLKNSGDKLRFRLLYKPVLEGNHFFLRDGKWDIVPCAKLNDGSHCEYCEKFEEAIRAIPRIEDPKEYKKAIQAVKDSLPGYEVGVTYNFPIIDRETGGMAIFQATPGMRTKLDSEAMLLEGKVFNVDFIAMNTGKAGKEKYAVSRVDSADTKPLTEAEQAIKDNFDINDFAKSLAGTVDENGPISEAAEEQVVNVDDIPENLGLDNKPTF